MAQVTRLAPIGIPGKLYASFAGKTEIIPDKGLGPFTMLHAMATPGRRLDFASFPKTEKDQPDAFRDLIEEDELHIITVVLK